MNNLSNSVFVGTVLMLAVIILNVSPTGTVMALASLMLAYVFHELNEAFENPTGLVRLAGLLCWIFTIATAVNALFYVFKAIFN